MELRIQRYNPEVDREPYMDTYHVDLEKIQGVMLLDVLEYIKTHVDTTLSFRRSCGGGVCGSDGMNINGRNGLACQTQIKDLSNPVTIYPLISLPIIRDLVVDMTGIFKQFESIKPYVESSTKGLEEEQIQSIQDRKKLDGLYECIMCGCCTSACPSSWWNPDRFLGPQALLSAARFIFDSRDSYRDERLAQFNDSYKLYRCRGIFNCVSVCPKGLNPTKAITELRKAHAETE